MELFTKLFNKINKAISPYKKNIIFPLLKILAVIILCLIILKLVGGNETLADYAAKNPEIAYQTSVDE